RPPQRGVPSTTPAPPAAVPTPPRPRVRRPAATRGGTLRPAEPPAPAPPPPPPATATAGLRGVAPDDARVVVLLRTDRIRASGAAAGGAPRLEALPDPRTMRAGTGLQPIKDFAALLIATSTPMDITAPFLAARHADDARLRRALARRTMPSWDPRVFRALD